MDTHEVKDREFYFASQGPEKLEQKPNAKIRSEVNAFIRDIQSWKTSSRKSKLIIGNTSEK